MDPFTEHEQLSSLLDNAPGNPRIWEQFLIQLTSCLNARSAALVATNLIERESTRVLFSINIPDAYLRRYEEKLNRLDIFNFFLSKHPNRVFCNQLLDKSYQKVVESADKTKSKPLYRLGFSLPCSQHYSLNLLIDRNTRFSELEQYKYEQYLNQLMPVLEKAIHTEQKYKINTQLTPILGEHFDGHIIVDKHLKILFADPVMAAMIADFDCISICDNSIVLHNPALNEPLRQAIENNQTCTSIHNQCKTCQITLIPIAALTNLYQWECYKNGYILAFLFNIGHDPTMERLSEIYNLSKCEAVCALHFMKTPSVAGIAVATSRSQETVRNHLKRTMQKMDAHNQAELMKKLLSIVAL
jgi:regulatory LuxR family protein